MDIAGQKGTGKWTAEAALEESDPLTLITEAVHARFLSAMADERSKASALYRSENNDIHEHAGLPDLLRHALYASKLISYAQGFSLLKKASEHYQWNLDYGMLAKIWRKGCIIRSVFLEQITRAYHALPGLENLLFDDFFPKPNTRGFACMEKDYGRLSVEWHSDSLHGCRFDIFRRFADRTFFCKSDSGATGLFRCSYV